MVARCARQRFEATGRLADGSGRPVADRRCRALVGWLLGGAPAGLDVPEKTEINVVGGGAVTPEFLTVLFGLTVYTAAYIAEVVRAGIQSVPYGQHEAAAALGLGARRMKLRLVQLPQALRVIIPPLTSQYLNLTKNSSLAVAVGYPDLVVDLQHLAQPDRPRHRVHRAGDGLLPDAVAAHVGADELVQPPRALKER